MNQTEKYFNKKYDFVDKDMQKRDMYIVEKDGKYGVIDHNENIIIPLIYDDYLILHKQYIIADKDGKVGLIDFNNNIIIPFEYDGLSICNGNIIADLNGKSGFINLKNEKLTDFIYTAIQGKKGYENFFAVSNGKWGIIDKNLNVIHDFIFDDLSCLDDDAILTNRNGDFLII